VATVLALIRVITVRADGKGLADRERAEDAAQPLAIGEVSARRMPRARTRGRFAPKRRPGEIQEQAFTTNGWRRAPGPCESDWTSKELSK